MNTNPIEPVGGRGGIGQAIRQAVADQRGGRRGPTGYRSGQAGGIGVIQRVGKRSIRGRKKDG